LARYKKPILWSGWKIFQIRIYFKRITVQGGLDFIT
jgi:hypothetical protein